MITHKIFMRFDLHHVDGQEGVYLIGLFKPELDLFMEKHYDRRLPYDRDGYVKIYGQGLNEMYWPVVQLSTIDLNFFTRTVLSEWSSGMKILNSKN